MFLMEMILILLSLLTIMFITLMERKFLGILNYRKGPNYFMMNSMLQSLIDFLKLLTKKTLKMNFIMKSFWVLMIFFGMMMFLMIMMIFPLNNSNMYLYMSFFICFMIYSLMAFFFLILSYSSNSIFSMMSMFRVLIQIISYEVGMIFMFMFPFFLMNEMNFFYYNLNKVFFLTFTMMFFYILILLVLSEMNRTPFEFLESETELVSGFNVEYFSSLFSFIFLVEYGFFLFMMILLNFFLLMNFSIMLLLTLMFIWTRSFMPRYRYDKMMLMFWKDLIIMVLMFYLFMNIN